MDKSNLRTFCLAMVLTLVFTFGLFAFCEVLTEAEKVKSGQETVVAGAYLDNQDNLNLYLLGKRRIIEKERLQYGINLIKKYQLALPNYIKIPLCIYDTLQNNKSLTVSEEQSEQKQMVKSSAVVNNLLS